MAVVKGVKEKVHLPLYDSIVVKPRERLGDRQSSNVLRFFQDVTGKTKLQTNMQAASLLPHWNTYEARALRVVISDLAAQFPDKPTVDLANVPLVDSDEEPIEDNPYVTIQFLSLGHLVELSQRLDKCGERALLMSDGDLRALGDGVNVTPAIPVGQFVAVDHGFLDRLAAALSGTGLKLPPDEQVVPNNGSGNLIGRFVYNTVTTFFVGEKVMIQVPTWFFPAGAGPYAEDGRVTTHGEPTPEATFRFAEPIFIDTQQNFRVEIEIPESDVLADFQKIYGPFFLWVVLDGFMTRDVQ